MTTTEDLARDVVDAIQSLDPLDRWAHDCHAASHAIVQQLDPGAARVARGGALGVVSQHSWVVVGTDCYDEGALIVDPTLWSYRDDVDGVWTGTYAAGIHRPHGWSEVNMIGWGCPMGGDADPIELVWPEGGPSREATMWLGMFERTTNLDRTFWSRLVNHAPMGPEPGWPAAEFVAAMDDTPDVTALVPIDILGMLTDRNPRGCYLRTE